MAVQNYNQQLFYPGFGNISGPLDATSRVQTYEDLSDNTKVIPYKGKLVNVASEGKTYVCSSAAIDGTHTVGTWNPVFNDEGTEFYIKAPDGRTVTLSIVDDSGVLRLDVSYPSEVPNAG